MPGEVPVDYYLVDNEVANRLFRLMQLSPAVDAHKHSLLAYVSSKLEFRDDFYGFLLFYADTHSWRYKPRNGGFSVTQLAKVANEFGLSDNFSKTHTPKSVYARLESDRRGVKCVSTIQGKRTVERYAIADRWKFFEWLYGDLTNILEYGMLRQQERNPINEKTGGWPHPADFLAFFGYHFLDLRSGSEFNEWVKSSKCKYCGGNHLEQYWRGVRDLGRRAVEQFEKETGVEIPRLTEWTI